MKRYFKIFLSVCMFIVLASATAACDVVPNITVAISSQDTVKTYTTLTLRAEVTLNGEATTNLPVVFSAEDKEGSSTGFELNGNLLTATRAGVVVVTATVTYSDFVFSDSMDITIESITHAEHIEAFKAAHATLLNKDIEDIEIHHKNAVLVALAAYLDHESAVQALLAEQKEHLDNLLARIVHLEEVDEFLNAHEDVLSLTTSIIQRADRAIVQAALNEYALLNEPAKTALATQKTLLDNLLAEIVLLDAISGFVTAHSAILDKTVATVTLADSDAVDAALSAYAQLSERAKSVLAARKTHLDDLAERIVELGITITGVTITSNITVLNYGDAATFTATVSGTGAFINTVSWSSSDTSVATIGATTGVLTILKAGEVVITATANGNDQIKAQKTVQIKYNMELVSPSIEGFSDISVAMTKGTKEFTTGVDSPRRVTLFGGFGLLDSYIFTISGSVSVFEYTNEDNMTFVAAGTYPSNNGDYWTSYFAHRIELPEEVTQLRIRDGNSQASDAAGSFRYETAEKVNGYFTKNTQWILASGSSTQITAGTIKSNAGYLYLSFVDDEDNVIYECFIEVIWDNVEVAPAMFELPSTTVEGFSDLEFRVEKDQKQFTADSGDTPRRVKLFEEFGLIDRFQFIVSGQAAYDEYTDEELMTFVPAGSKGSNGDYWTVFFQAKLKLSSEATQLRIRDGNSQAADADGGFTISELKLDQDGYYVCEIQFIVAGGNENGINPSSAFANAGYSYISFLDKSGAVIYECFIEVVCPANMLAQQN